MPPTLDELRSPQIVSAAPAGDDIVPFYDVSEFGNAPIKKATLSSAVQAALVADPQGGREALELDDGNGYIPSNGVVLSDLSAVIAPSGTLARQGSRIALHDGATTGGIASRRRTGLKILSANDQRPGGVNSDLYHEVFRVRLTAAEFANAKVITVIGTTTAEIPGANCDVYFGVAPEESAGTYVTGVLQTLRKGITFERRFWSKRYVITALGALDPADGGSYVDGPSLAVTREGIDGADEFTTDADGTLGIEQDLVFALHTSSTGAVASAVYFSYDLEINVITV